MTALRRRPATLAGDPRASGWRGRGRALAAAASAAIPLAGLVVAAGTLVVRYRRTRGTERQQLVAAGTSVALLPLATGAAILGADPGIAVAASTGIARRDRRWRGRTNALIPWGGHRKPA